MKALSQNEVRASVHARTLGAKTLLTGSSRCCFSTELGRMQISVYGTADPGIADKDDFGQILQDIPQMFGSLMLKLGMTEIMMNNQNVFRHAESLIHRESNQICGRVKVVVRLKKSVKAAA